MRPYIALIHKDAESDYGVSFPDLPGYVTAGKTREEARAMAAEALSLHLESLTEGGDPIPERSCLDTIMADKDNREHVAFLVEPPQVADQIVRVNITVPESALAAIDAAAEAAGMTRSGYIVREAASKVHNQATERSFKVKSQLQRTGKGTKPARTKKPSNRRRASG